MSIWRQLWEIVKLVPGHAKGMVIRFLGGEPQPTAESAGAARVDEEPTT